MRTLLQLAAVLALVTVSVGTAVLVWDAHALAGQAQTSWQHVDGVLSKAEGEWQNEKTSVHQIIGSAQESAAQTAALIAEQRAQLRKTSQDSDHQVRAVGLVTRNVEEFFYHLDQQFNGKILPDFDRELIASSTAAQFSFESLTHASDALTFQLQDPNISQMAEHLNVASFSLSDASANTASATKHLDAATADIEQDVHRLTRPPSFAKQLGMSLLDVAAKLGNISAGFVK